MKLYEIDSAIQAIYDQIEQQDGVLPDELESALDGLQMERTAKISNVLRLLRNIDGDITKLDVEIACLNKKLKVLENRKQSVRNFLAYAVGEGNKFKDEIASVYWNNSEAVEVSDVDSLPRKYIREIVERSADKKAIKAALESGVMLEGCQIVTKKSMVVR